MRRRTAIGLMVSVLLVVLSPLETATGEGAPAPVVRKAPEIITPTKRTEAPKVQEPADLIPEWEMDWFARAVWAEAGTEDYTGMRLVAAVILNRTKSEHFPASIYGVITQPGQFEAYSNGSMQSKTPNEEARKACRDEINQRTNTEVLFFRTKHYHTGTTPVTQYKRHYFSK